MMPLTPFAFDDSVVRIQQDEEGNPWFVAKDVCDVLELTNPTMAIENLDEDERAKLNLGRQGEANFISESGLYALIFRSRKPEAKRFRKWVTQEVLPTIRKHGAYQPTEAQLTPSTASDRAALKKLSDAWATQSKQPYSHCYTQISSHFNLASFTQIPVEWIPDALAFVQERLDAQQKALPQTSSGSTFETEARLFCQRIRELKERYEKERLAIAIQAMQPFFHIVYEHEYLYDILFDLIRSETKNMLNAPVVSERGVEKLFKDIEKTVRLAR